MSPEPLAVTPLWTWSRQLRCHRDAGSLAPKLMPNRAWRAIDAWFASGPVTGRLRPGRQCCRDADSGRARQSAYASGCVDRHLFPVLRRPFAYGRGGARASTKLGMPWTCASTNVAPCAIPAARPSRFRHASVHVAPCRLVTLLGRDVGCHAPGSARDGEGFNPGGEGGRSSRQRRRCYFVGGLCAIDVARRARGPGQGYRRLGGPAARRARRNPPLRP